MSDAIDEAFEAWQREHGDNVATWRSVAAKDAWRAATLAERERNRLAHQKVVEEGKAADAYAEEGDDLHIWDDEDEALADSV